MKIPNIQFDKLKKQDKPKTQEIYDDTDNDEEAAKPAVEISEATLRKVWAGEIAAAVLLAFVSVIIAFIG